ncbi:MAG: hypothetical protein ABL999_10105 [Pyrinomonadaceae bacterium]
MKVLILSSVCTLLAVACGSPAPSNGRSSSTVAKTNVNAVNSVPYEQTENAYTTASNSELGTLAPSGKAAKEIIGKTATEIKLWQNKKVDPQLRELLGEDYSMMRRFWNTETPIKKFGDFLMLTGCEKQNCSNNRYVVFMNMATSNIEVVHIGKDTVREWTWRSKEYSAIDLPPPFAEELAAMKSKVKLSE